jgi:phosphate/sulfate permease
VRTPTRPAPEPLEGSDRLVTSVITAGWAVALIIVLILRDDLAATQRWWIWTCVFGTGMGLFGFFYVPRLKRSRARAETRRAAARSGDGEPGLPL